MEDDMNDLLNIFDYVVKAVIKHEALQLTLPNIDKQKQEVRSIGTMLERRIRTIVKSICEEVLGN